MDQWRPLLQDGILDDPWLDGQERLSLEPIILSRTQLGALAEAACCVVMMIDEAVQAAVRDDLLLHQLGLDQSLCDIVRLDAPRWLGLARADVFEVAGGGPAQVCELNCDTPTGLAECIGLGRSALSRASGLTDPSARLRERWVEMVKACVHPAVTAPVVGIIDPTEMTEDLCHIRQLTRWLESAGMRVVRGAPFNLHACPGTRVGMFDQPCDVLLRHYKTDAWAQRTRLWHQEILPPDTAPLGRELGLIAAAMAAGTVGVMNPWGAGIAQNKRVLALPWERPEIFAPETLEAVRRHLPQTRFLSSLTRSCLIDEQADWVLKSDYGCEGSEVIVGRHVHAQRWAACLDSAVPDRWVAQRAFSPKLDEEGRETNHGIYLIGGMPSGLYSRRSRGPTGRDAVSFPTLVEP